MPADGLILAYQSPNPVCDFTVSVYAGSRVYKLRPDGSVDEAMPLTNLEDIQEGDTLALAGLDGYCVMKAKRCSDGTLFAEEEGNPQFTGILCFDRDDRHCWTDGGFNYFERPGVQR